MAETTRWTRVRIVSIGFAASRVNDWIVLEHLDAWPWEMLRLNVSSEFSSFWDFCQYSNCLSQVGLPLVVISALMKCSKSRHCCLVFNFNGGIAVFVKTFHIYLTRMTGVEVFCTPSTKDLQNIHLSAKCLSPLITIPRYLYTLAPKFIINPSSLPASIYLRIELKQTCMEIIRFILGYFFDCV